MLKVADWQLKNPKHEPNDWTNGAFYARVFAILTIFVISIDRLCHRSKHQSL